MMHKWIVQLAISEEIDTVQFEGILSVNMTHIKSVQQIIVYASSDKFHINR
jgi:hypothetical protein